MRTATSFLMRQSRKRVFPFRAYVVLALLAVITVGCNEEPGVPVTGTQQTASEGQAETAATISVGNGEGMVVVAYNDGTNSGGTITYGPDSRTIYHGASLMGWSYSKDKGQTWTYGGKLAPPKGWPVLWGDPAITVDEADHQYVFMSNLAIPEAKMLTKSISGSLASTGQDSNLGGACIARSADGGVTFQTYQCVSNKVKNYVPNSELGHFYDGGSMASTSAGAIYAAFEDVATEQIDVWSSPDANGKFTMLPTPFPKEIAIWTHPRLRVNQEDGSLYAAAQGTDGVVFINRFSGGAWGKAVQATEAGVIYPNVNFGDGLSLRTGPQFSFDIGAASGKEKRDAIRFLYTRRDSNTGRLYVTGSFCPLSLSQCYLAPEWGTTPGNLNTPGDQFNPNVAAFPGSKTIPPAWKATFLNRDGVVKNGVTLEQGNLAYLPGGQRIYVPFPVLKDKPVCSDNRGFWGDYGAVIYIGIKNHIAQFMATISDSSLGCDKRWEFESHNLHIRSVVFQ